ncbi:pseudouridine synthase [Meira miltonrushii]|uniref:Pseudouridine synthase n=1 Tax=Meira miltonrushii TaxID=1280837 RepID=A0A316VNF4_9BASI|nr:pseudouridine synthase [Meira miltonrushii]PWN37085.1 pseudouridine synthase [Meira miltonrushii]
MNGSAIEDRYRNQSREQLLARIAQLETSNNGEASTSNLNTTTPAEGASQDTEKKKQKASRPFDINRYPCRKIALRFSYDGEQYSGLEMQTASGSKDGVAVGTVESALWRALSDARIVDDSVGLPGVGWSRCGRTDRGVSAAGQVVAFWARSRKVDEWPLRRVLQRTMDETQIGKDTNGSTSDGAEGDSEDPDMVTRNSWRDKVESKMQQFLAEEQAKRDEVDHIPADPDAEELPYVLSINRLLPKSIRVQAWSPVSPAFNSRFDCQYRHYKYFFSSGAPFVQQSSAQLHGPIPPLDIDAMRSAAQRFLGEHDFRNFCKVDPSKQMDNFTRRIDGISIDPVSTSWSHTTEEAERSANEESKTSSGDKEQMYVLNLRGTAFLYHQVRHITSVLFLVGAGLEKPSIIDELLNVKQNGVFVDRLLSAKVSGLVIDDDSEEPRTVLPPSTANDESADSKTSLVHRYQRMRKEYEQSNGDVASIFESNHIEHHDALRDLYVFDRKPIYEMAMDRPLMLWECGFNAKDVSWRSGTYDGAMTVEAIKNASSSKKDVDVNSPSSLVRAQLHAIWNAQSITAEMYRHFALAVPSDANERIQGRGAYGVGYLPANTPFQSASYPALESETLPSDNVRNGDDASVEAKTIIPLGLGRFKTSLQYTPLRKVSRQATPAEKNERWQSTRGKRRAEKLAAAAKVDPAKDDS